MSCTGRSIAIRKRKKFWQARHKNACMQSPEFQVQALHSTCNNMHTFWPCLRRHSSERCVGHQKHWTASLSWRATRRHLQLLCGLLSENFQHSFAMWRKSMGAFKLYKKCYTQNYSAGSPSARVDVNIPTFGKKAHWAWPSIKQRYHWGISWSVHLSS